MTTTTMNVKTPPFAGCSGVLRLLALLLLLGTSQQTQAQSLRLQALEIPTSVVEAGRYRHVVSVGAPTLGGALAVHRARYRFGSSGVETLAEAEAVPSSFALESNYPNPFNPTTTIPFALPSSSEVTLAVYDLLGRRVAVLVEGPMAAGRHEVRFEADHFSSGVYLVRMQSGSFSEVRRMTLVK